MQLTSRFQLQAVYWALLVLLMSFGHSGHPLNSDEGVVLNGAWGLWNGQEPYTDFFEIVTPGSFYAVYWLWGLFGPHYVVAKVFALLCLFLACAGIYLTGRLLASNVFSYVGPLLYALSSLSWPLINHNTFNIVLVIWAIYFFVRSLGAVSIFWIAVSGLTAGASALFLQHKSALLVLATAAFLAYLWLVEKRSAWLKGLAIYLVCVAAPMLVLLKWPLEILFENLVYFPLFHYMPINRVSLWPFYLACWALIGSFALLSGSFNRLAGYLLLVQAALLLTALQRTDLMHVSIALAPLLALLPYLQERAALASKLQRLLQFGPVLVLLIGLPLGIAAIRLPYLLASGHGETSELVEFVRTSCDETPYLYAGPFIPGLYYESRKLNATSFSLLLTHFNTTEQFGQARKELEIHKPSCIVTNYAMTKKFGHDLHNPVDEFISANYKLKHRFGRTELYVRER